MLQGLLTDDSSQDDTYQNSLRWKKTAFLSVYKAEQFLNQDGWVHLVHFVLKNPNSFHSSPDVREITLAFVHHLDEMQGSFVPDMEDHLHQLVSGVYSTLPSGFDTGRFVMRCPRELRESRIYTASGVPPAAQTAFTQLPSLNRLERLREISEEKDVFLTTFSHETETNSLVFESGLSYLEMSRIVVREARDGQAHVRWVMGFRKRFDQGKITIERLSEFPVYEIKCPLTGTRAKTYSLEKAEKSQRGVTRLSVGY